MPAVRDALLDFWTAANQRIHATLGGLVEEHGVEIEAFLPDSLEDAYAGAGDDFERALEFQVLLDRFNQPTRTTPPAVDLTSRPTKELYLASEYQQANLEELSLFALYIGQRMLDMTRDSYRITDKDFVQGYQRWHGDLRRIAGTVYYLR